MGWQLQEHHGLCRNYSVILLACIQNTFSIRMRIPACIPGQWEVTGTTSLCSCVVISMLISTISPELHRRPTTQQPRIHWKLRAYVTTCGAYFLEAWANVSGAGVSLTEHTAKPSRILIKEVAGIWGVRDTSTASAGEPWLRGPTLDWWDASCRDSAWLVRIRSFSCYFKLSQVEPLWLCFLGMKNH